jgi:hypothetical protein
MREKRKDGWLSCGFLLGVQMKIGITEFLAAYAAILSSIALGWALYRDLIDRAKLQVSARVRRIAVGADGKFFAVKPDLPVEGASKKLFVVMTVVNVGRRPALWQGWGGRYHKRVNGRDSFFIVGRDLPKMLQEGETHSELTELEDDLRPANDSVKSLYIWDASGKHWKLSRRQLKELKEEAKACATT